MRTGEIIGFAAILSAGFALAATASSGSTAGDLSCATDTASEVANATLTNRGYDWSTPGNPDPTWRVDIPDISQSIDVQAPDETSARATAKKVLDSQIVALECPPPPEPSTETVTTTATTTNTVTRSITYTTPAPDPVTVTQPLVVTVPGATQIVTTATPIAASPSAPASPQPIIVNVSIPGTNALRLRLAHARCFLKRKRVACSRLRDGKARKVVVSGTWFGDTLSVSKITG